MNILLRLFRTFVNKLRMNLNGGTSDYFYVERIKNLVSKGLKIGRNVIIDESVVIDSGYPYLISIGDNCSITHGVRLIAHDDAIYNFTGGYARIGKIEIKENCFIAENAIILPGVTIGPNVLVAPGSVVNKDIPPNSCVAGVPARFYARFDEFIEKNTRLIKERPMFQYFDLRGNEPDELLKQKVKDSLDGGACFVKGKDGSKFNTVLWNPL